jgi:outer membrane protein assembly factor BamA
LNVITVFGLGVWLLVGAAVGPAQPAAAPQPTIVEIQVHGNLATPEEEVLALAGVSVGAPFDESLAEAVAVRLRQSGRFDGVEVLKRFASMTDLSKIVLVILVDDGPVSLNWYSAGEEGLVVSRRSRLRPMILPILDRDDGYGFTYGARVSFAGRRSRATRVSFPLTWGGHKRAGAEFEALIDDGPVLTRVIAGGAFTREENPFYERNDDRRSVWIRGERRVTRAFAAGVSAGFERVSFAGERDSVRRVGIDAALDTRLDPLLPRNAVFLRAALDRLSIDGRALARRQLDLRGYGQVIGQSVLMGRGVHEDVSAPLPAYLQPLLGGMRNLRGFRAGSAAGDILTGASLELFAPVSSPLNVGRLGFSAFLDVGAVYNVGQSVHRQKFERAIGGSVWASIPFVRASFSVARGLGSGTRTHFGISTSF